MIHVESPFSTQVKLNGADTIPRVDVLVSAAYQSPARLFRRTLS
jgi:hypothetical protein